MGRHIPHLAIYFTNDDTYQIIDGKQRLSSIFDFIDDKFTIELEGAEYLFSELPEDYKRHINTFVLRYYNINESDESLTDEDKISWFTYINFAGTPQDKKHLENLKK